MGRKEQRILRYIIIPAIIILVGLVIYFVVGRTLVDMIKADIEYAVVMGQPVDADNEQLVELFSDLSEGTISADEWVKPVVGEQYGQIKCDTIELDVPLYCGDSGEVLLKGAGQSLLSHFPGEGGTVLIGAHDTTFFAPLEKLNEGHTITVDTVYGKFAYEVKEVEIVSSAEYDIKDDVEQLVLYTCYPFGDVASERNKKIIFECDKVSGPVIGGSENE